MIKIRGRPQCTRKREREEDAETETGGGGGLPWPEPSSIGDGCRTLRRAIARACGHDSMEFQRGKREVLGGFKGKQMPHQMVLLIARNRWRKFRAEPKREEQGDDITRHHFFSFYFLFKILLI